jgi:hypothetical protein
MYDDTAEIRSMEGEWMDRKRREFSKFPGHLRCLGHQKNEKKLFISSFHTIYNNIQFRDNLKLWTVSVRVRVPCLPFIHTFSTMIYNIHCDSTLVLFVPSDLNL